MAATLKAGNSAAAKPLQIPLTRCVQGDDRKKKKKKQKDKKEKKSKKIKEEAAA